MQQQTSHAKGASIALVAGSCGLAVYWFGTGLFLDLGGVFGYGALLLLSTFALIFGIIGLYRALGDRLDARARPVVLIGVALTSVGLVSRSTITFVGLVVLAAGLVRVKALPVLPLVLVLVGAALLGFEELRYGASMATRNDRPIAAGTPLTTVRWLAGIGHVAGAIGWTWIAVSVARSARTASALPR